MLKEYASFKEIVGSELGIINKFDETSSVISSPNHRQIALKDSAIYWKSSNKMQRRKRGTKQI